MWLEPNRTCERNGEVQFTPAERVGGVVLRAGDGESQLVVDLDKVLIASHFMWKASVNHCPLNYMTFISFPYFPTTDGKYFTHPQSSVRALTVLIPQMPTRYTFLNWDHPFLLKPISVYNKSSAKSSWLGIARLYLLSVAQVRSPRANSV